MKKIVVACLIFSHLLISDDLIHFETTSPNHQAQALSIHFQDVSMLEFLRFVSTVTEKTFIYDEELLDFNISLVTGKETDPSNVLKIMIELLGQQGIRAEEREGYYLVEKMDQWEIEARKQKRSDKKGTGAEKVHLVNQISRSLPSSLQSLARRGEFHIYKLQYHVGTEILGAIKNIASSMKANPSASDELLSAIESMQWVEPTNSILYSGTEDGIEELTTLIEVLVIETDVKKGLEFGLEWGGGGQYRNKVGYGLGNFPANQRMAPFAKSLQEVNATHPPTGASQFPLGRGFDMGVIGDIILHKGQSYFSLGSLVSALEADQNSTIILNQKIITQDNKLSRIFVGDNIAFTGSVVETIGASQQTSSNIEYRDVGVKLNITPLLGDEDVITLEISEEITDVIPHLNRSSDGANGINTTKTDMATQVHVPDQSFLVLSGMIRNTKRERKSGVPCMGGLPLIGAAFSKTTTDAEKRNVIVFVRPQIIKSDQTYTQVTEFQERQLKQESPTPSDFQRGLEMLQHEGESDGASHPSHTSRVTAGREDHP